jgi:hypothetical protein
MSNILDIEILAWNKDLRELAMSRNKRRRTCNKIVPLRTSLFMTAQNESASPVNSKVSVIGQTAQTSMECAGGACAIVWKPIPKVA